MDYLYDYLYVVAFGHNTSTTLAGSKQRAGRQLKTINPTLGTLVELQKHCDRKE